MTDGQPTDSIKTTHNTIKSKNAEMGNRVVILTFGLGAGNVHVCVEY